MNFQVSLLGNLGEVLDTYSVKVGIRTITWSNTTVYINEKPMYLRGFGMHEDSDVSITFKYKFIVNIILRTAVSEA